MTTTDDAIDALQDEITNLKAELLDRYQELATMQKQMLAIGYTQDGKDTRRATAEAELAAIKKSRSWRVTKPLRRVVEVIKKR